MEKKVLLQLFAERVSADPALAARASHVTTAEELIAFAKGEGVTIDPETAARLLPAFLALTANDGKLTDDALDAIAGGYLGSAACNAAHRGEGLGC